MIIGSATLNALLQRAKRPRHPNNKAFDKSGVYSKSSKVAEAVIEAERTDRKVILPAEVLAEILNRIGHNIGRQDAVLAGNVLLERNETGGLLITPNATDILAATLHLFKTVQEPPDKRTSFVDCLVTATASFYDAREIFSFDAVIGKNGYRLPTNEAEQAA